MKRKFTFFGVLFILSMLTFAQAPVPPVYKMVRVYGAVEDIKNDHPIRVYYSESAFGKDKQSDFFIIVLNFDKKNGRYFFRNLRTYARDSIDNRQEFIKYKEQKNSEKGKVLYHNIYNNVLNNIDTVAKNFDNQSNAVLTGNSLDEQNIPGHETETNYVTSDINNLNQYTRFGDLTFDYDANGNMTRKGVQHFQYDYRNQLVRAYDPENEATYKYDPLGRRIEKNVNGEIMRYYYSGHQIIEIRDGLDQVLRQYIWGNGIDEIIRMDRMENGGMVAYYFHTDAQGSVTAITDANGNIIERVKYDMWGEPSFIDYKTDPDNPKLRSFSIIGNDILFHGHQYDYEIALFHWRARAYDPQLGRFLQPDPMGYHDSMNLYQAFNTNPMNFQDPMGQQQVEAAFELQAEQILRKHLNKRYGRLQGEIDYFSMIQQRDANSLFAPLLATDYVYNKFLDASDWGYRTFINPIAIDLGMNDFVAKEGQFREFVDFSVKVFPILKSGYSFIGLKNQVEEALTKVSGNVQKLIQYNKSLGEAGFVGLPSLISSPDDVYAGVKAASAYLKSINVTRTDRVKILQSFDVRTIKLCLSTDNTYGIRFFGGKSKPVGYYLFETFENTINRNGLSLPPEWCIMNGLKQWKVKPDIIFLEGRVAPQFKFGFQYIGGAKQWWIPDPWKNLIDVVF